MHKIKSLVQNNLIKNMMFNTVAAAIPIFLLQLIILPYLSRGMNDEEYGLLVAILAVLNVVPTTFGNGLNNIRLLHNNRYAKENFTGDYSVLALVETFLDVIIVIAFSIFYFNQYTQDSNLHMHISLIAFLAILWLWREYLIVAFLIELRYDRILINNILLAIGYILGVVIYFFVGYWEIIYLVGYSFSLIYISTQTSIWREPLKKTPLFWDTTKETTIYLAACVLYRLTSYADKMLLYPILGGTQVSIYYVATLSSKVISLLISPISNVMLSYLSKKRQVENKTFKLTMKIGGIACVIGYICCLIVSRPILSLLYPQYVDQAMQYIYITTATVVVSVLISLINPYVLKCMTMKWQIVINSCTLVIYVSVSLVLLTMFGLKGFCYGTLLANIIKLIIMILIYRYGQHTLIGDSYGH